MVPLIIRVGVELLWQISLTVLPPIERLLERRQPLTGNRRVFYQAMIGMVYVSVRAVVGNGIGKLIQRNQRLEALQKISTI